MKLSKHEIYGVVVLAVAVLGAIFFFYHRTPAPAVVQDTYTSSTTDTTTGAPVSKPVAKPPASIVISQGGDVGIKFDTTNLSVGSIISTITMTLPSGSDGKVLVLTLRPPAGSAAHEGVLFVNTVHPTAPTYNISGLRLSTMTDLTTGTKVNVVPGTYVIQAVLWDKTPFGPTGTYTNIAGNNGTGTQSASFTVSAAQ